MPRFLAKNTLMGAEVTLISIEVVIRLKENQGQLTNATSHFCLERKKKMSSAGQNSEHNSSERSVAGDYELIIS